LRIKEEGAGSRDAEEKLKSEATERCGEKLKIKLKTGALRQGGGDGPGPRIFGRIPHWDA